MAFDVTNALSSFSSPDQYVQFAAQLLTQGGPEALAEVEAQLNADGRGDLGANLANAADFAATMNGRGDIKGFIEGGGLQYRVQQILSGG